MSTLSRERDYVANVVLRVFVDGRGRPEIMRDMESRIKESNVDFEKARAIMVRVSRKSRPKIR